MSKILVVVTDKNTLLDNVSFNYDVEVIECTDQNDENIQIDFSIYSLIFIEPLFFEQLNSNIFNCPFFIIGNKLNRKGSLGKISFSENRKDKDNLSEQIHNIISIFNFVNKKVDDLDIEKLLANQLEVYQQIKNIHTKVVPLREYTHKGIKLYSKYMVGRSNGGEYFIVDSKKENLYIFQSTTSSYLTNSLLISFSTRLSDKKTSDDFFESFISYLEENLNNDQDLQKIEFLWLKIDVKSLKVEGFSKGEGQLFLNKVELDINQSDYLSLDTKDKLFFSFNMKRNDKLLWLSSGCIATLNEKKVFFDLQQFINTKHENHRTFFEDLFFEFSNKGEDDFLNHDSTCLLLEVGANVIHKI